MSAVGVVLAGGRGRRMGSGKATVEFDGVALLHYPLRALTAVTDEQAVVAKRDTRLPELPAGVALWLEPDQPRHPLTGVMHALRSADADRVLCCAVDLPRLDAATLGRLLEADDGRHACVVPRVDGHLEPLCAIWRPRALEALARLPASPAMRDVVAVLDPLEVTFADARPFANVNTPEDLLTLGS
ncbi:MAG: molybdenum cofactor guanylyltransferase [Actinomycetota bacterium]|nr:molybdenum cofactor guanylyltransferase [Actinomycetota bacterium]